MVWDEAELVVERVNRNNATNAVLMQMVVASVLSPKKGGAAFAKTIKRLNGDGE